MQWRFVRELVPRRRQHEFRCSAVCTIGDVWEMRLKVRVTQYSNEIRLSPIACIFSSTSRYGAAGDTQSYFWKCPLNFISFLKSFWILSDFTHLCHAKIACSLLSLSEETRNSSFCMCKMSSEKRSFVLQLFWTLRVGPDAVWTLRPLSIFRRYALNKLIKLQLAYCREI